MADQTEVIGCFIFGCQEPAEHFYISGNRYRAYCNECNLDFRAYTFDGYSFDYIGNAEDYRVWLIKQKL